MRAAERGHEIVESGDVGQVRDRHPGCDSRAFPAKQIIRSKSQVQEVARSDAGRVCVIVSGSFLGQFETQDVKAGPTCRDGEVDGGNLRAADHSDGRLLSAR